MASMLISGFSYDLLGDTVCQLLADPDQGVAQPSVSEVQSTYLDGASVTGRGAANRQISLPIAILETRSNGADQVAAQLQNAVGQQTWQITFTPDGGMPIVYDCFRATVTQTNPSAIELQGVLTYQIDCEALPFGRSPTLQTVTLAGPSVTLIDGLETVPTIGTTGGASPSSSRDSTNKTQGSYSTKVTLTVPAYATGSGASAGYGAGTELSLARTITALTLGGGQALQVDVAYYGGSATTSKLSCTGMILYGSSGNPYVYTTSGVSYAPGNTPSAMNRTSSAQFSTFTLTISGTPPAETIVSYQLKLTSSATLPSSASDTPTVNVDNLRAVNAGQSVSDTQGGLYQIPSVLGTARTPASLALSLAGGGTFGSFLVHRPPQSTPTTLLTSTAQSMIPLNSTGSASYTCPASVRFEGTYDLWLSVSPSSTFARTYTVTVTQGGVSSAFAVSVTPIAGQPTYINVQPTGRPLTLPLVNYPSDSSSATSFTVSSSMSGDTLQDLLLIDTAGQTVIVSNATAAANAYIDPPTPATAVGGVWNGAGRSSCLSVGSALVREAGPGPTLFDTGPNQLLIHSPAGVLTAVATYAPRWQQSAAA